ncbi:unnamed protein product [Prunus armeniaca]|uniref:Cyclin-like domain-containing protein n=1 Tax=Prunus armeniaca TaxID=36596 RepID=A0A6J5VIE3_PRUAR|nr:unnamed protein product [Prunus armeniaca]
MAVILSKKAEFCSDCTVEFWVCCGVVYAAAWRFQVPLPENPPWWKAFDAEKSGIDEVCRVLAHLYSLPKAKVCCGVVYAAAWRFQVPLPENPPWWKAFDAEKSGIDEVCRVLAHLYSLPKAKYVPVCKDGDSFTFSNKSCNSQPRPIPKAAAEVNPESGGSKGVLAKLAIDKLKDSKESDESMPIEGEAIEDFSIKSKFERKMESSGNKSRDRDRDRDRERDKERERERERDRDRDRDRDRMKVRGAGILTGNEIEKGMRGTEPRTEVIVQRIEQKIQGAFGEIKTSVVPSLNPVI